MTSAAGLMAVLLAGTLSVPASAVPAPVPVDVYIAAPQGLTPWVTVTPLGSLTPGAKNLDVRDGHHTFALPGIERVLICAGAPDAATQCLASVPQDQRRYDFSLTAGRTVEGMAILGRTPAARAELRVRLADLDSRRPFALPLLREEDRLIVAVETGADGRFELCHLEPGEYIFDFALPGGRIFESERIVVPAGARDSGPFELSPFVIPSGLDLAVAVVDAEGAAVPNAEVGATQSSPDDDARPLLFRTRADAQGRAQLRGLAAGYRTMVACIAEGYARTQIHHDQAPVAVTCALDRLAGVAGTVRDGRGAPVAGASVSLTSGRTMTTGANGEFEIAGVAPGEYVVTAVARGFGKATRAIVVPAGHRGDVGSIVLPDAERLDGRVVDATTNAAVEGAGVELPKRTGVHTRTDADGRFTLPVDPSGEPLRVTAPGYADLDARVAPSATGYVARLHRPGKLHVQVWRAGSGAACSGCTVTADSAGRPRTALTDAAGQARFDGLTPGVYYVVHEVATAGTTQVTVSGGSGKTADVRAGETAIVELGTKANILSVHVTPAPEAGWELRAWTEDGAVAAVRRGIGIFELAHSPGSAYRLILSRGDVGLQVAAVPAAYAQPTFAVTLPGGAVRVTFNGEPQNAMLELRDERGEIRAWTRWQARRVVDFPYLPEGHYTATAAGRTVAGPFSVSRAALASVMVQ